MSEEFSDIKITGVNEDATRNTNPSLRLYDVVLNLSSSAPSEWSRYFNQRWENEFYMMKRIAVASAGSITIQCVLDELGKDHLPRLKSVIAETNQKYREYLAKQEKRLHANQAREKVEKEKVQELNKLNFD
jgi:hypothetical protein